jgi:large subunit ribosomal protein L15
LGSLTQISAGAKVTPLELSKLGYIKDPNGLVKILGDGELKVSASFHAHAFSQSAEAKIVQAGGTVNILPRFEETADTTA